ncbi:MAG: nucleoside-diphosphate kinase [Candidatus Ranarchaeia archaeon]|jgi:nucleoside-diphosphate kinase
MTMLRTLLILKPEVTIRRSPGVKVIERLLEEPFTFFGLKRFQIPLELVNAHYAEHREKPFFPWLRDYIRSAPVMPLIVEGEDVISHMRVLLGSTMVQEASPDSLRGKYGIWKGINVAHASDSQETAEREISLWKNLGRLDETYDSKPDLMKYIERWDCIQVDHTQELRRLSKQLEAKNIEVERITQLMRDLLFEECIDIDQQVIDRFLKSMVDNVLRP